MAFCVVNKERCTRDGLCSKVCPLGLIRSGEGGLPEAIPGADVACIGCGHCMAVCPHQALRLSKVKAGETALAKGWNLSLEGITPLLKGRRSVRVYRKEAVSRPEIEALMDVARYGPTGKNTQTVRWVMIHSQAEMDRHRSLVMEWIRHCVTTESPLVPMLGMKMVLAAGEAGYDPIFRTAPHLLVALGSKSDPMVAQSSAIQLTYFEIAAAAAGLGTCWGGYYQLAAMSYAPLREALSGAGEDVCYGAMMFGRPAIRYSAIPERKPAAITWR